MPISARTIKPACNGNICFKVEFNRDASIFLCCGAGTFIVYEFNPGSWVLVALAVVQKTMFITEAPCCFQANQFPLIAMGGF